MDWPEAANLKQEMSLDLKICFHFKTCVSIKTLHILNFISTKAEWQCLGVKRNSVWNWSLNICCKTHSLELKYSPEFLYFSAVMEVCCFSNLCVCICVCVFSCVVVYVPALQEPGLHSLVWYLPSGHQTPESAAGSRDGCSQALWLWQVRDSHVLHWSEFFLFLAFTKDVHIGTAVMSDNIKSERQQPVSLA